MKKSILTIIAISIATVQMNAQSRITFGGNINYYVPTEMQKKATSPLLFLQSAQSVGIDFLFTTKKSPVGIKLSTEFIMGNNDKNAIANYAKEKDLIWTKSTFSKSKPNGFIIMAGPNFGLFNKSKSLPLNWITLNIGSVITNQQSLQYINSYNGNDIVTSEIKNKPMQFAYGINISVVPIKTKSLMFHLNAGYTNYGGGHIGIGISERNCTGAPCFKCNGPYCNQ